MAEGPRMQALVGAGSQALNRQGGLSLYAPRFYSLNVQSQLFLKDSSKL